LIHHQHEKGGFVYVFNQIYNQLHASLYYEQRRLFVWSYKLITVNT